MEKSLQGYIKDYKIYMDFTKIIAGIGLGSLLSQNYIGAISNYVLALYCMYRAKNEKKQSKNAKEFQIINFAYEGILEILAENITKLGLTDIEGIFAYVCYLYENNYLSYDQHLPQFNIPIINESAILPALSLNNHGVCRNKAPMLADLYKLFNIEAYGLTGTRYDNGQVLPKLSTMISEEEIKEIVDNDDSVKEVLEVIQHIDDFIRERSIKEREMLEYIPTGNHVITQANSKDYTYLLDPSNLEFHMEADKEGRFYTNRGDYFKIVSVKKKKNLYKEHLNMEIVDKKPIIGLGEMTKRLYERSKVIQENKDIIENMHKDMEPLLMLANDTYNAIIQAR